MSTMFDVLDLLNQKVELMNVDGAAWRTMRELSFALKVSNLGKACDAEGPYEVSLGKPLAGPKEAMGNITELMESFVSERYSGITGAPTATISLLSAGVCFLRRTTTTAAAVTTRVQDQLYSLLDKVGVGLRSVSRLPECTDKYCLEQVARSSHAWRSYLFPLRNLQLWDLSSAPLRDPCEGIGAFKFIIPGLLSNYAMQSSSFLAQSLTQRSETLCPEYKQILTFQLTTRKPDLDEGTRRRRRLHAASGNGTESPARRGLQVYGLDGLTEEYVASLQAGCYQDVPGCPSECPLVDCVDDLGDPSNDNPDGDPNDGCTRGECSCRTACCLEKASLLVVVGPTGTVQHVHEVLDSGCKYTGSLTGVAVGKVSSSGTGGYVWTCGRRSSDEPWRIFTFNRNAVLAEAPTRIEHISVHQLSNVSFCSRRTPCRRRRPDKNLCMHRIIAGASRACVAQSYIHDADRCTLDYQASKNMLWVAGTGGSDGGRAIGFHVSESAGGVSLVHGRSLSHANWLAGLAFFSNFFGDEYVALLRCGTPAKSKMPCKTEFHNIQLQSEKPFVSTVSLPIYIPPEDGSTYNPNGPIPSGYGTMDYVVRTPTGAGSMSHDSSIGAWPSLYFSLSFIGNTGEFYDGTVLEGEDPEDRVFLFRQPITKTEARKSQDTMYIIYKSSHILSPQELMGKTQYEQMNEQYENAGRRLAGDKHACMDKTMNLMPDYDVRPVPE